VLRPGTDFLILQLAYRDDVSRDRADVARLALETGFEVRCNGAAELRLWDGLTFHLRNHKR
jgi:hypothetical protein